VSFPPGDAQGVASRVRILREGQRAHDGSQSLQRDEDLAEDIARLKLVCEALWSFCSERFDITTEQLRDRMLLIDQEQDGRVDGMHHSRARPCPACESMVPADRDTCQYCGVEVPGRDPFD
jgi:hypothetical protein